MHNALFLFSLAILVLARPAMAVDLTPRFSDQTVGGVVHRRLFFANGDQKIYITLGFSTTVEAGAGGAVFRFRNLPKAQFIMRRSPMAADEPFQGVSLERYREAAHRLLPTGSTDVKLIEEAHDPVTLNQWHSYRFLF